MSFYMLRSPGLIKEKTTSLAQAAGPVWTPMWHGFPLKASGTAQGPGGRGHSLQCRLFILPRRRGIPKQSTALTHSSAGEPHLRRRLETKGRV